MKRKYSPEQMLHLSTSQRYYDTCYLLDIYTYLNTEEHLHISKPFFFLCVLELNCDPSFITARGAAQQLHLTGVQASS